jgi:hypothetical protein
MTPRTESDSNAKKKGNKRKDAQWCPNMVTRLAGMTYIMGDTVLT